MTEIQLQNIVEKTKRKNIISNIVLAIMILGIAAGGIFAYWQGGLLMPDEYTRDITTITIGEGTDIESELEVNALAFSNAEGLVLVPDGFADFDTTTDAYDEYYMVNWQKKDNQDPDVADTKKVLKITVEPVLGETGINDLIGVWIDSDLAQVGNSGYQEIEFGKNAQQVRVDYYLLREPENKAEYDLIANNQIKGNIKFEVIDEAPEGVDASAANYDLPY